MNVGPGNRNVVIIATTVGGLPTRPGLSAENVEAALNESLQRLQKGFMDVYYAHYDDENVAVMSNFEPARMREGFETAKAEDLTLPVAIQPQHNLIHSKDFEEGYKPIVDEFDVAVFPCFALASGVLADGRA